MGELALLGGKKLRSKAFPNRISMGAEEKEAAMRVLDSDVLSGFVGAPGRFFNGGKEVVDFENLWTKKYNFNHAISTNSWTTGLQVCFGAIGIEPGDEILCPPYTMSASAIAAMFYGAIPVFVDIDPLRYTIDPNKIEEKITPRTKAIVAVHLFGYPAEMDAILKIAKKFNLLIVEDAAQSPGAIYKGRPVGAIGDIGGFSLNFHKHIHTGEGGLIVTNRSELALRCQMIRNHGENAAESYELLELDNMIGSNYRYTELQAAIAIEQFKKLDIILNYRTKLAKFLDNRLKGIPGLNIQVVEVGSSHSYYMYPIRFDSTVVGVSRSTFVKAVTAELPAAEFWDTTPLAEGYIKPLYMSPVFQKKIAIGKKGFPFNINSDICYDYSVGSCPIVEDLYNNSLVISPLVREGMTKQDIDDFADAIEKVMDNTKQLKSYEKEYGIYDGVYDPIKAIDANVK